MQNDYQRLDKVVNKAKARRDTPGPDASFISAIKQPQQGQRQVKKQALARLPPLIFLVLGVPDASLQSACLCGSISIFHSFFLPQRFSLAHGHPRRKIRDGKDHVRVL